MSDFVQFETNVSQALAFAYDDGKLVETRYGDKVFYTLVDGRTLSVTPDLAARIDMMGIRKQQPFLMMKAEVRKPGARKPTTEWRIQVAPQGPDMPPEPPDLPEPPAPPELRRTGPAFVQRVAGASVSAPTPGPTITKQQQPNGTNGHANGTNGTNGSNGRTAAPPTKIPMNLAVTEAVEMVKAAMLATGEQWSDQSRQGLVSTIIIQAGKEGWLAVWERGGK